MSQGREQALREECFAEVVQCAHVTTDFETARMQAQEWLNREGQAANSVLHTYQCEARRSHLELEMVQQEANMLHTRQTR
eukprot:3491131-Amphidinium_carterae.2